MSDTVKLIIEMPKETYKGIMLGKWDGNGLAFYVKTGTPLDDVKAEIEELKSCCDDDWDAFLIGRKEAYNNVLQIIDKHIGKAESKVSE